MSKRIEDLDKNFKAAPVKTDAAITWQTVDAAPFAVDGLPWFKENGGEFYRLPKRAKSSLRESLWDLGTMPSGGRVRFKTDSPILRARVQHSRAAGLAMPHMCAVGVSGLDLYEGPPKRMTFWNIGRPGHATAPYEVTLFADLPKKLREFTIYFPTYDDLKSSMQYVHLMRPGATPAVGPTTTTTRP